MISVVALLAAGSVLSVGELVSRHRDLVGQEVIVVGWLSQCQPLSCSIDSAPGGDVEAARISLGTNGEGIEKQLRAAAMRQVELTVRVNDNCWPSPDPSLIVVCTDRASNATPLKVRVVGPPTNAETVNSKKSDRSF